MPPSKQARSAQNRQKDRLAIAAVEKHRIRRRRRIIASIVAVVVVAGLVAAVIATRSSGKKVQVSAPTTPNANNATTVPPTTATASAKGKHCVTLKDKEPKGAPPVPILPGPPPTKLIINDIKQGTGAVVPKGATVTVDYIGVACSTGKIFDSSWSRGQTASFPLSGVIPGWTNGIPGMKVGGERELVIPSDQAYGPQGRPPTIAPDESLYFVIDMRKFTPAGTPTTT